MIAGGAGNQGGHDADVAGRDVQPVREESQQTRLGRGFYATRRLRAEAIAATAHAVARFAAAAAASSVRGAGAVSSLASREELERQVDEE